MQLHLVAHTSTCVRACTFGGQKTASVVPFSNAIHLWGQGRISYMSRIFLVDYTGWPANPKYLAVSFSPVPDSHNYTNMRWPLQPACCWPNPGPCVCKESTLPTDLSFPSEFLFCKMWVPGTWHSYCKNVWIIYMKYLIHIYAYVCVCISQFFKYT